jgi:hypothetical protein
MSARRRHVHHLAPLLCAAAWTLALTPSALAIAPKPVETVRAGMFSVSPSSASPPSVAVDVVNGDVYVAYVERESLSAKTFSNRLARRPRYGNTAAPGAGYQTASLGTAPGRWDDTRDRNADGPMVAALPAGGVVVVWNDENGLWIQTWEDGQPQTTAQRLTTGIPWDQGSEDIALAVDGAGRAYVAWTDDSEIPTAQRLAIRSPSGTLSGPLVLDAETVPYGRPQIAVRSTGGGWATWGRLRTGPVSVDVRARAFSTTGPTGSVMTLDSVAHTAGGALGGEEPGVGVESVHNRAIVAWVRGPSATGVHDAQVFASTIDANGTVTGPVQVSYAPSDGSAPPALGDAAGNLLVGYNAFGGTAHVRSYVGGALDTSYSFTVSTPSPNAIAALGVPGAEGVRALVTGNDSGGRSMPWLSSATPFSIASTPLGALPATGSGALLASAAMDPDGNAYAVFMRNNGNGTFDLDLGIADAAAPSLGRVVVPTSGVAGTPVAVGADATDIVGPVTLTWSFGDTGPIVTGTDAEHVYAAAGTYTITVKATDASGQSTVQTRSIAIAPAPVLPGPTTPTAKSPGEGSGGAPNVTGRGTATTPDSPNETKTGVSGTTPKAKPVPPFKVSMLARGRKVIGLVAVGTPQGAKMVVMCRRGCGRSGATLGRVTVTKKRPRARVKRSLKAGAVIEIRITAEGRTGRYARFVVLKKSPYSRRTAEGCLGADGRSAVC